MTADEKNEIGAMMCEILADLDAGFGYHGSAASVREYAKRFEPKPEPRFKAEYNNEVIIDTETGLRHSAPSANLFNLMNTLADELAAAKRAK